MKTLELCAELLAVVWEALRDGEGDKYALIQGVRCWLELATGQTTGDETYRATSSAADRLRALHGAAQGDYQEDTVTLTPAARWEKALELARADGRVTSGKLAKVSGCTPECARVTLVTLARIGELRARGAYKGRYYELGRGLFGRNLG